MIVKFDFLFLNTRDQLERPLETRDRDHSKIAGKGSEVAVLIENHSEGMVCSAATLRKRVGRSKNWDRAEHVEVASVLQHAILIKVSKQHEGDW